MNASATSAHLVKILTRIVAVYLVPCLLADPMTVMGSVGTGPCPRPQLESHFTSQALIEPPFAAPVINTIEALVARDAALEGGYESDTTAVDPTLPPHVSPEIAQFARDLLVRAKRVRERLTRRQREVLQLASKGLNVEEMAAKLLVARGTIWSELKSLKNKLGLADILAPGRSGREAFVQIIQSLGLVDRPDPELSVAPAAPPAVPAVVLAASGNRFDPKRAERAPVRPRRTLSGLLKLTAREKGVLNLRNDNRGMSNREIAKVLGLSKSTIDRHLQNIRTVFNAGEREIYLPDRRALKNNAPVSNSPAAPAALIMTDELLKQIERQLQNMFKDVSSESYPSGQEEVSAGGRDARQFRINLIYSSSHGFLIRRVGDVICVRQDLVGPLGLMIHPPTAGRTVIVAMRNVIDGLTPTKSTHSMMLAIDSIRDIIRQSRAFIDVGAHTGILGCLAGRYGNRNILFVERMESAHEIIRENAEFNGIKPQVRLSVGDIPSDQWMNSVVAVNINDGFGLEVVRDILSRGRPSALLLTGTSDGYEEALSIVRNHGRHYRTINVPALADGDGDPVYTTLIAHSGDNPRPAAPAAADRAIQSELEPDNPPFVQPSPNESGSNPNLIPLWGDEILHPRVGARRAYENLVDVFRTAMSPLTNGPLTVERVSVAMESHRSPIMHWIAELKRWELMRLSWQGSVDKYLWLRAYKTDGGGLCSNVASAIVDAGRALKLSIGPVGIPAKGSHYLATIGSIAIDATAGQIKQEWIGHIVVADFHAHEILVKLLMPSREDLLHERGSEWLSAVTHESAQVRETIIQHLQLKQIQDQSLTRAA